MTQRLQDPVACIKCGLVQPQLGRFCSACGWDQHRVSRRYRFSPTLFGLMLLTVALLWGAAQSLQNYKPLGKRPTKVFEDAGTEAPEATDPNIEKLRAATRAKPDDKEAWKALAGVLIQRVQTSNAPSNQMLFDLVDALREVLRLDPMDTDALRAMADASLNNQILDKAIDYYARYLALIPQDLTARGRYGSALAMASRYQEAMPELQKVLAQEPKNFSASAYLALTYAGLENKEKALEVGRNALTLAEDEEARSELKRFLDSLEKGEAKLPKAQVGPAASEGQTAVEATQAPAAAQQGKDTMLASIAEIISGNPVAGSKFSRVERDGNGFKILMRDFPMSQMPPFAKQKFLSGVTAKALAAGVPAGTTLLFVDEKSSQQLESMTLK